MTHRLTHNRILVTGGAGFIGSAVVRHLLAETSATIINVDKLTYAASPAALASVANHPRYAFEQVDITNRVEMDRVLAHFTPDAIMHLAAETHVDRSIDGPMPFVQSNVVGTAVLLEAALAYLHTCDALMRSRFRFVHVSTDEVYGCAGEDESFCEDAAYAPNSPYAASKAASDHLVRAWHTTYDLPTIITNSSNNYGEYQFPEKLIPLMTIKAIDQQPLPIYGDGLHVRDWLHVQDHVHALCAVLAAGQVGRRYNIGAGCQKTNLQIVQHICDELDRTDPTHQPRRKLICHVDDRPGHDRRYAMNTQRIEHELHWSPQQTFPQALRDTIGWYITHESWWREILAQRYQGERLGIPNRTTSEHAT
jgi:dTDP-glucose 4,6-dehydratase